MMEIEWIQSDGPISEEIIWGVQRYFGIEFPQDYIECVMKFNGGYPEPDSFDIDEDSELVFLCLLSFTSEKGNIKEVFDMSAETLEKGVYPFARDPFGNLLCFDYRENVKSPTVIFFDHETDSQNAIYQVCNTFTELLESLYSVED